MHSSKARILMAKRLSVSHLSWLLKELPNYGNSVCKIGRMTFKYSTKDIYTSRVDLIICPIILERDLRIRIDTSKIRERYKNLSVFIGYSIVIDYYDRYGYISQILRELKRVIINYISDKPVLAHTSDIVIQVQDWFGNFLTYLNLDWINYFSHFWYTDGIYCNNIESWLNSIDIPSSNVLEALLNNKKIHITEDELHWMINESSDPYSSYTITNLNTCFNSNILDMLRVNTISQDSISAKALISDYIKILRNGDFKYISGEYLNKHKKDKFIFPQKLTDYLFRCTDIACYDVDTVHSKILGKGTIEHIAITLRCGPAVRKNICKYADTHREFIIDLCREIINRRLGRFVEEDEYELNNLFVFEKSIVLMYEYNKAKALYEYIFSQNIET